MFDRCEKSTRRLLLGWLGLAVFSLLFAGLFAILIVLARTPGVEGLLAVGRDYVYVGLVGHVVLAFVIWFLAFEGFLWVYTTTAFIGHAEASAGLGFASLALSALGVGLVVVSAAGGLGAPVLANYVPVLMTPWFYAGLALFAAGIVGTIANSFATAWKARRAGAVLPAPAFGMMVAGVAVLTAFVCFALVGWFQWRAGGAIDFERLNWGGGHVLQFANTVAVVSVWLYLSEKAFGPGGVLVGGRTARALFLVYLAFIIPAPFIYIFGDPSAQSHLDAFTWLMRWGHGPSTGLFILAGLYAIIRRGEFPWKDPVFSSLLLSMIIYVVGGLIAMDIRGVNTKIPAHYHSVIVAITIAFMAVFYLVMPLVGRRVWSGRMASVQPYLYSFGIVLFVAGLYVAGSYGMERKAMAGAQNLDTFWKTFGMALMGFGGLVAISGGVTFVWNALMSLFSTSARRRPSGGHLPLTGGAR
ncbi:MAG: cbb3-type cytochrome c oxidase subunit I [Thermodesulfobacteriota bacterium]